MQNSSFLGSLATEAKATALAALLTGHPLSAGYNDNREPSDQYSANEEFQAHTQAFLKLVSQKTRVCRRSMTSSMLI